MIYILITDSCIYKEPEDLLSWVAHRPASSERLIGQWPPQPTRGPDGHPLMLTQSVCVSVYPCVSVYNAWILWASGTFASSWAQRGCSAHASGQHLHEVNQRGPEVIVTTFPCQSGRYFDKKLSTLCCVRQNCTSLLKNYSIPWDIINSLDVASSLCVARIIIDYHQISKFKSSLMLDVIRCASRLLLA